SLSSRRTVWMFQSSESTTNACWIFPHRREGLWLWEDIHGLLRARRRVRFIRRASRCESDGVGYGSPFDPDEVIDSLRCERYMKSAAQGVRGILLGFAKKSYYTFRPFMSVRFRKHLQRIYLGDWDHISFPGWPVDRTVEHIFEELLALSLRSRRMQKILFGWFWPDGYSACVIVTHDIETK